ncbi:MAG: aminoglycoside phosphotransferase family protein [Candidatus Babeliales bacterium]
MKSHIAFYQQHLNLRDAIFEPIIHENAIVAIVYKIRIQSSNTSYILKICTRAKDYLNEVYFLNYFANILTVPRIIQVIEPEEGVNGAILMEYIPGTLLTLNDFTNELAYQIGQTLARIHQQRTTSYGDLSQPDSLSNDPRTYFIHKFEEGLAECGTLLPQTLVDQCRAYFNAQIDLLLQADGPCIVHRDFRPGNIIINNGKLQGIIDWSAARASFAQEDFCSLEHNNWPANPEHKESFMQGYASIRAIPDYHAIMPLLRLCKALAVIGFTVKRGTWQNQDARLYRYNREFLDDFFT